MMPTTAKVSGLSMLTTKRKVQFRFGVDVDKAVLSVVFEEVQCRVHSKLCSEVFN